MQIKKIIIAQSGNYGDCLYATTIAKQIKSESPESHLTWAISTKYKSILDLNPHVDEVLEIPKMYDNISAEGW